MSSTTEPSAAGGQDRRAALLDILAGVAAGLPAPLEIVFREQAGHLSVDFASAADLKVWAPRLNLGQPYSQPYPLDDPHERWSTHAISNGPWRGFTVFSVAADPFTDEHARQWVETGRAAGRAAYVAAQAKTAGGAA